MKIFLIILLILLVIYFVGSYIIYRMAFYSPVKNQNDFFRYPESESYKPFKERTLNYIQDFLKLDFEEVCIKSREGLKLYGRFFQIKEGAPVDICCHGWRSNGVKDYSAGTFLCFKQNHNVLVIDERSQGISEGHTITFGVKEREDILRWVNYVIERFGNEVQINLVGISMGAASVLMAAGLGLPSNVHRILADCPFSSPMAIIRKVCDEDMHLPSKLLFPLIVSAAALYGRFNILEKSADAVKSVKNSKVPILIIHGESDTFVPSYMSQEIADANPAIKREVFAGADHGLSFMVDTPRYEKLVTDFLQ